MKRATLAALRVEHAQADADFERLVRVAASLFNAPAAALVLMDEDTLWFYTQLGFEADELPAPGTPWAAVLETPDVERLVVADLAADPRFPSPAVPAPSSMRGFVGVPVAVHGQKIAVLGVLWPSAAEPPGDTQLQGLDDLAHLAGATFELKEEAQVRARMAAELIKEEWRHALTLEAGRVGSWVWDVRSGEIASNDIMRQMYGLAASQGLHIDDLMQAIDKRDLPNVEAALAAAFDGGIDYAAEFRVGSRWLIGRGRVYQRDATGKPLIVMGVNIDVTDAREAAEQTRALLRELNHRVKNTLAMIQAVARQTLHQKPDPQQFIDAFSGRLRTLSEAHALLSDSDWSGIGLIELVSSQVEPYVMASPEQLTMIGADLRLPPDHALGLGLIIHELASNAAKFGALSDPNGRVAVSWTLGGDEVPQLELAWRESGGPAVSVPRHTGFGTRLIERGLDKVLGSSVELRFPAEGAEARISMPLD